MSPSYGALAPEYFYWITLSNCQLLGEDFGLHLVFIVLFPSSLGMFSVLLSTPLANPDFLVPDSLFPRLPWAPGLGTPLRSWPEPHHVSGWGQTEQLVCTETRLVDFSLCPYLLERGDEKYAKYTTTNIKTSPLKTPGWIFGSLTCGTLKLALTDTGHGKQEKTALQKPGGNPSSWTRLSRDHLACPLPPGTLTLAPRQNDGNLSSSLGLGPRPRTPASSTSAPQGHRRGRHSTLTAKACGLPLGHELGASPPGVPHLPFPPWQMSLSLAHDRLLRAPPAFIFSPRTLSVQFIPK